MGRAGEEGPEGLLPRRVGTGSDHRPHSCRTGGRAVHRRATPRRKKPTPAAGTRPRPSTSRTSSGRSWRSWPFIPNHADLADRLARAVTDHATPVGSGTVARTKRIPVEQRAEAAVIAWMRHQTTGYDGMVIPEDQGQAAGGPANARPGDPMNCWTAIAGESRRRKDARSRRRWRTVIGSEDRAGIRLVVRTSRTSQGIAPGTPQECHKNAT